MTGSDVLQQDLDMVEFCDSSDKWLRVFPNCQLVRSDVEALASIFLEDVFYSF